MATIDIATALVASNGDEEVSRDVLPVAKNGYLTLCFVA